MVLVLLNFLLAIICEAFNQAKAASTDNTSVAEEIRVLVMEYWHRLTDRGYVSDTAVLRQLKVWCGRDPDSDLEGEEEGGERRSAASGARLRARGARPDLALKISDDTYVTQEELEDIVGLCIRESAAEGAMFSAGLSEVERRGLAEAEAERSAPPLASALFQRCAQEIQSGGQADDEEEDVVDEAELAANEHFRAVNDALGKLMGVHQELLQGHLVVTENQRKVDQASRSVARINADLRRVFSQQRRGRRGSTSAADGGGRRYSVASVFGRSSMAGLQGAADRKSFGRQSSARTRQSVGGGAEGGPAARQSSGLGTSGAGLDSSVRRPPPAAVASGRDLDTAAGVSVHDVTPDVA